MRMINAFSNAQKGCPRDMGNLQTIRNIEGTWWIFELIWGCIESMLETARVRRFPLPEIVLWTTASQHPSESQTSECSDLLSRSRATFVIAAQRQPGKLH